jgi:hypothetical protein
MAKKITSVILAVFLALAMVATFTSAALNIAPHVEVDGMTVSDGSNIAVVAGDVYPVTVQFVADKTASDVEVSAWIQGERSDRVERVFEDLIEGHEYKARLSVVIPEDLDPEEELTFYVRVESDEGNWEGEYTLYAQRQAYNLDMLLVEVEDVANVGSTVPISVVIKNMGRHEVEDTMVKVEVSGLGISKTSYFEDLAPTDVCDDDKCDQTDSRERRIFLSIPSDVSAGTYELKVTAYNDETETTVIKTLRVTDTETEGTIISNPATQKFAVGQEVAYDLVLVNTGSKIAVYNLAPSESDALSIRLSDSLVIVPAGSSKVVTVYAKANREGTFTFNVDATSENFSETANFVATVEGTSISNNALAITIVLAIIFVVLVVILAVLLTRKTEKNEEFGESYY